MKPLAIMFECSDNSVRQPRGAERGTPGVRRPAVEQAVLPLRDQGVAAGGQGPPQTPVQQTGRQEPRLAASL